MSELHRISAAGRAPQADVIFVHGLDGHPFKTWQANPDRQIDCWPYWLSEDAAAVAVHTLEYQARSSEWLGRAMPLVDRAKEVLNELSRRGVGERPIVLVCHSLGGLLVKQLLRTASDDAALPSWRNIAGQTNGVVFIATPHAGADLARTLRRVGWALRRSPAIEDLRAHAPALRDLNEWYRGYAVRRALKTLCYYETYKTGATRYGWIPLAVKVVEEGDADPGLGVEVRPMPLDADHISIAKAPKRDHQLYEAVLKLVHELVPDELSNDRPSIIDPLRMRGDLTDFQDRGEKQRRAAEVLSASPSAIVAICGMGGSGKSVLAVHVAHELGRAGETPDGQRLLDLHGVSESPLSPLEAMARIAQSFDEKAARPANEQEAAIAYHRVLDGKRVLIVLDNARDDKQVAPLLAHRSLTTRIIVTSRRMITAEGIHAVPLDEMSNEQAARFLRDITGTGRGNQNDIARLVRRCGRLPLAMRVAGRFLVGHPGLSIENYIEAVDKAAVKLAVKGEPETDVRAVLGLSAHDLAREDITLAERWQMLAVFPDDFDRAAAAAVWEVEDSAAALQLSELAARSMILHDEATRRWRLHDLMRDVAQVPVEGEDAAALEAQLESARARHAQHYCGVLSAADELYLKGGESVLAGLALYDLEQRNLTAGQAWTVARIDHDDAAAHLAADYPNAGVYVLAIRLHRRERVDWLEAQLSASARLGNRRIECAALGNLGNAWADLGEPRRTIEHGEQALAIARELGDRGSEGAGLTSLAKAWWLLGEPRRAIEYLGSFGAPICLSALTPPVPGCLTHDGAGPVAACFPPNLTAAS